MRAAELQIEHLDFPEDGASPQQHTDPRAALKQQVAARLAEHRSRRGKRTGAANLVPIADPNPAHPAAQASVKPSVRASVKPRANQIATAVAERYAQTQSYRDFLAAEAARAIEAANAAAEVAARNAQAVAVAQQQLLAELDLWDEPKSEPTALHGNSRNNFSEAADELPRVDLSLVEDPAPAIPTRMGMPAPGKTVRHPVAGLTVRLYEDAVVRQPQISAATRTNSLTVHGSLDTAIPDEEENFLLYDEIAFRQTPVFPEPAGPPVPIPANLIEFPRQLVAPRKSRPRLAEGPLREEANTASATAQLRIFEVEPDQISTAPSVGVETVVPEWSSIHLDATPAPEPVRHANQEELQALLPLETASLDRRVMAAAVDACILAAAFLGAVAVFGSSVSVLPAWPVAAAAAGATLLVLFILYHMLFFTFSESTPGMRYARIGLCTFSDENPTRAQMRRRTWAVLLSACPLGIGFLWALLDDDRLGWHDRISRMYQRAY
jgi:uncharacterized RDD family membrane protein YckC